MYGDVIYLDNASTTMISSDILDVMMPYLTTSYGNPGTKHRLGRKAGLAMSVARQQVADFLGSNAANIVFTSGGTEANNIAVFSAARAARMNRTKVISCVSEHESVIKPIKEACARYGLTPVFIEINSFGEIKYQDLIDEIDDTTAFVSVMRTNNETGAVNDIKIISDACRQHGVLLHVDAVQAAYDAIGIAKLCDFVSISAHKLHAPKGVGALYVKDMGNAYTLIRGGGRQEFGVRGGTENVPGIVGLGAACSLILNNADEYKNRVESAKDNFLTTLITSIEELSGMAADKYIHINSNCGRIINIRVVNVDSESILLALDACGICVSSGAACSDLSYNPSRVLTAMGLSDKEAKESVRISFSWNNTVGECLMAAHALASAVLKLSKM